MPPPLLPAAMNASVSMALTQGMGDVLSVFQQVQVLQGPTGTIAAAADAIDVAARLSAALQASESFTGLVSSEDASKIRGFIQSGNHLEALQRLSAIHAVVQLVHEECTKGMPAAASLPLGRIADLFGLPRHEFEVSAWDAARQLPLEGQRSISTVPPARAASASRVELDFDGMGSRRYVLEKDAMHGHSLSIGVGREPQSGVLLDNKHVSLRHATISFSNGHYWLQDTGSTNGTYHNGRRLTGHERVPLRNGDRVQIGPYAMTAMLPYQASLKQLEDAIRDAPSYRTVFTVLRHHGFGDAVPAIGAILQSGLPLGERLTALRGLVPYDGGLLIKLESLLLRGEVVRIRSLYFPKMTPEQALETSVRLTASLAQAHSYADLAERLRHSDAAAFAGFIDKLERFTDERMRFSEIPEVFGLRDQVKRLFLEGLSIDADQRNDLRWRGVTADMLDERPWKKIAVSPLLKSHLDPFRDVIGKRLNMGQWRQLENTLVGAFADERDEPEVKDDAVEDVKSGGTQFILYDKYQGKGPPTATGPLTESHTESKKPTFFERIAERLMQDGTGLLPGGYWFFGGSFGVKPRFDGRIYLSLVRRHAEAIFRHLAKDVQGAVVKDGGRIQFKIAGNPEGYKRADAGVIYFHAQNQETILAAIRKMHGDHPEFFKPGAPLFTMPLLEGLSFGEHPLNDGESFGSLRTGAMTTAVRVARALLGTKEPPDWEEIRQMCAYFLGRAGVDIENPAFNSGGQDKFGPVLAFSDDTPTVIMKRPDLAAAMPPPLPVSPAPAPVKPARPAPPPVIMAEIRQRYPDLAGSDFNALVERMASNMFALWKDGDRFPGKSPNAPTYLPEDIFDRIVADVMAAMESGSQGARVGQLAKDLKRNDQGPRDVRALSARLRADFPSLRHPAASRLVLELARDVYAFWQKGADRSEKAREGALRLKLFGLRNHLIAHPSNQPHFQAFANELRLFLK